MKDQFYVVLPSNSSMHYYSGNTTTRFITRLPQQIHLQGSWSVALTEIRIPLTFQHIPLEREERFVSLKRFRKSILKTNLTRSSGVGDESTESTSIVSPGVYKNSEILIHEINNLPCVKNHLEFCIERGHYVSVKRLCAETDCIDFDHKLHLSNRLKTVLGFDNDEIVFETNQSVVGVRPVNLSNSLPSMLMVYTDIIEPYFTGDVQTRLLRSVSLGIDEYTYGSLQIKSFSPPMYFDLLFNSFETIEIDIRDQHGSPIPFDYGTLAVTLHFKRVD